MSGDPERLARIQARLTEVIPPEPKDEPKPRKTWRRLKPGQLLQVEDPVAPYLKGDIVVVVAVHSQGATLRRAEPDVTPPRLWERPDWERHFRRARKPRGWDYPFPIERDNQ